MNKKEKEKKNKISKKNVIIFTIIFLLLIIYFVLWPLIRRGLKNASCKSFGEDYHAILKSTSDFSSFSSKGVNCKSYVWVCENSEGDIKWINEDDKSLINLTSGTNSGGTNCHCGTICN